MSTSCVLRVPQYLALLQSFESQTCLTVLRVFVHFICRSIPPTSTLYLSAQTRIHILTTSKAMNPWSKLSQLRLSTHETTLHVKKLK